VGLLSNGVGLLSNGVGLLLNGVGLLSNEVCLFLRERVLENTPTPLFEQPLKFIGHEHIFERLWYIILPPPMHMDTYLEYMLFFVTMETSFLIPC